MKTELNSFDKIQARLRRRGTDARTGGFQLDSNWLLTRGLETRRDAYHWHGLSRGGDSQHPYLIFQFTLEGEGAFDWAGKTQRLLPGEAFLTVVPSEHAYYLPKESPSWTFFWITVHHRYVVERLRQTIEQVGPVFSLSSESRVTLRALDLWEQIQEESGHESLVCEQRLFEWMFECERFGRAQLHPQDERERWLQEVRARVLSDLSENFPVEKLAAQAGLSRSYYSHLFKAATGLSPAMWVQQIRLEEVARRLRQSDDKLQKIAMETGYGDANHLCKVFRRFFHLSPNQFRRQMQ